MARTLFIDLCHIIVSIRFFSTTYQKFSTIFKLLVCSDINIHTQKKYNPVLILT